MAKPDRKGYTITEQTPPSGGQTTFRVNRDADGAGLGAYHDDDGIDAAIEADRKAAAEAAKAAKATTAPRKAAPDKAPPDRPADFSTNHGKSAKAHQAEIDARVADGDATAQRALDVAEAQRPEPPAKKAAQAKRTAKRMQAKKAAETRTAK